MNGTNNGGNRADGALLDECRGCPLESHNHHPTITQELLDVLASGRDHDSARLHDARTRAVEADFDKLELAWAIAGRRQAGASHGSGYGDNKGTWGALQDTLRDALNILAEERRALLS